MFKKFEKQVLRPAAKGIEKANIKKLLDPDRDLAREALAAAERDLVEINHSVLTAQSQLIAILKRVEVVGPGIVALPAGIFNGGGAGREFAESQELSALQRWLTDNPGESPFRFNVQQVYQQKLGRAGREFAESQELAALQAWLTDNPGESPFRFSIQYVYQQRAIGGEGYAQLRHRVASQLALIQPHLDTASQSLSALKINQSTIKSQEAAARLGKDTVINIPDQSEGAEAVVKGRQAREAAQAAAGLAHQSLLAARLQLEGFNTAIANVTRLLEEALAERLRGQVEAARALEVQLYGEERTPTADAVSADSVSRGWWINQENVVTYFQRLRADLALRNEEAERLRQEEAERLRQAELLHAEAEEDHSFESQIVTRVRGLQAHQAPLGPLEQLDRTLDQILDEMGNGYRAGTVQRPAPGEHLTQIMTILTRVLGEPTESGEQTARQLGARSKFASWLLTNFSGQQQVESGLGNGQSDVSVSAPSMLPMHNHLMQQAQSSSLATVVAEEDEVDAEWDVVPTRSTQHNSQ